MGPGNPLAVGPGDDAFVGGCGQKKLIAATCDVLVEDIHFRMKWCTPEQLGYKSMAVNLSDLAAMGKCSPKYALIGLALTAKTPVSFIKGLYKGMRKAADKYGLIIAGGDTVSSKSGIVISVSLIGEISKKDILTRSGARPGDLIAVSGSFGDSGAGLEILKSGRKPKARWQKNLVRRHLLPEPRLALAAKLTESRAVTSMIDSSDGLAASLKFITESSGAGAEVDWDRVPFSKDILRFSRDIDLLRRLALGGGEEYELVFTVKPGKAEVLLKKFPQVSIIGRITKGRGVKYSGKNGAVFARAQGYEHFK